MLLRLHHHEKIHGMHSGQQNLNMFLSDWSGKPFRYPFYRDDAFDQASYDDFLKDEDLDDLMFVGIDLARNLFIGFIKDGDYDRFSILNSYVSEYDKLCKTIAILYLFNFLAEADKISRGSNSDFNGMISKANFFSNDFAMFYIYHFIRISDDDSDINEVGQNYKELFDDDGMAFTRKGIAVMMENLSNFVRLPYFHETAKTLYEDYAKQAGKSLDELHSHLEHELSVVYDFLD